LNLVRSGQLQNLSGPVRSKSDRIIFDVNPAKKSKKVRFIFDVTLTKIRQKSGKKSGKNPVSSGPAGPEPDRL
jgi:hypothetical protein